MITGVFVPLCNVAKVTRGFPRDCAHCSLFWWFIRGHLANSGGRSMDSWYLKAMNGLCGMCNLSNDLCTSNVCLFAGQSLSFELANSNPSVLILQLFHYLSVFFHYSSVPRLSQAVIFNRDCRSALLQFNDVPVREPEKNLRMGWFDALGTVGSFNFFVSTYCVFSCLLCTRSRNATQSRY